MPSDANGVYSLPSGYEATTGEIIQASQHNPPLEDLASAISQRLMRSGVAPMTGPLKIVDGSVGSPAVKFSTDGTTGFYKTTNGIGVSVGGTKVAEFTSSGLSWKIGMMIPWVLLSAPSGWVLPYGQTLSRTTYADLWTIAQDEISNGNTFFNNGNGTTTFGIGDMRDRVPAGKGDMGGTDAGRLTASYFGTSATVLGAAGGSESQTLTQAQLPTITPSFVGTAATLNVSQNNGYSPINPSSNTPISGAPGGSLIGILATTPGATVGLVTSSGSYTPAGSVSSFGSGNAHNNVQPTMICNYILYAGT